MTDKQKKVWDQALVYASTSQTIKKMVAVHLPKEKREDFRGFLLVQLAELKPLKLIESYENGYIDWLCLSIINAQSKSRSSRWNRMYEVIPTPQLVEDDELVGILPSQSNSVLEIDTSSIFEEGDFDLPDEFTDPLEDMEEQEEYKEYQKTTARLVKKISNITNEFSFYSKELWRMRHKEGLSMREISRLTGINYNSVYYNLRKNERLIKQTLADEPDLKKVLKKLLNE
jgi:DNA-directed RNA polymerase specialized sigma24 family protein